jgi:1H-pyrrole-2-carbonyl-[peptidyl-carrier protein] chlorinase
MQYDFDVGIICGSPARSTTTAYLARAGLKYVVIERQLFPREHVGESLVPATNRVLRDIGFIEQTDQREFILEYGAVWISTAKAPVDREKWEGLEADC